MRTAALIVAAGRGVRAGGEVPKQYVRAGDRSVLAHTLGRFLRHAQVESVLVVIGGADREPYERAVLELDPGLMPRLLPPVVGGATRQVSVRNGLEALAARGIEQVLIHDAVRPYVPDSLVAACLAALHEAPGAIAALPMTDTVKSAGADGFVTGTLDRAPLWRAQTPQAFRLVDILAAHRAAAAAGLDDLTDDAAVAEHAGLRIRVVPGSAANTKITSAEDLAEARQRLGEPAPMPDIRTGQGYDIHVLAPGDHVWLCGVRIPHDRTLAGHSDADVGLHALTDALLGTIADADIGEHFRNTDPRWRGAASHQFLADALRRVQAAGGEVRHVDVTLLCEAPKIAPHRTAMRTAIGGILGLPLGRVSVKATTNEGLGAIGRREGIAALATATVTFR